MKKKILSLLMSFCFVICGLFSLSGCSVVREDSSKLNKKEVMRVGNTELTKSDVVNSFYTYYQSNSSYFSYYDEETIEESFYTWATIKQIVKEKAFDALYDAETNPNGYIVYNADDEKDVIDAVYEYIYSQVSSYETAIYELKGYEKDEYPVWIQTEEEEEEAATSFESYKSVKPEIEAKDKADSKKKLTDEQVKTKVDELKKYLFEYVSVEAEDEDEEDVRADIDESKYIVGARNQAYAHYIEGLVSNAKANGTSTDANEVLLNELVRVYNAYYDSQISSLFQKYWLENYLLGEGCFDIDGDGVIDYDKESLSEKAVVKAYLEAYFTDVQLYQVEDSFIAALTDDEGTSLILYNYQGRNFFFTVQHILIKYDDYISEKIAKLPGYSASGSDYDADIYEPFAKKRNELTDNYTMLTKINEEALERFANEDSITVVGGYYYYDEEYADDKSNNNGYLPLTMTTVDDVTVYTKPNGDKVAEEDVLHMASIENVLDSYNSTLTEWVTWVSEYLATNDEAVRENIVKEHEEIAYVFETALNMHSYGKTMDEISEKLASLLFVELQWIYSSDGLGNEFTNKLGYVVSNYDDENGNWVVDFAVGARNILASLMDGDDEVLVDGKKSILTKATNVITSNYGYHLIKIENVYESGKSLVDMSKLTKEINIEDAEFVSEMADLLKQTYVCEGSNQTVYDYFYDELYTSLVGNSSSSGTYFMKLQYEWLAEYHEANKIDIFNKISYDELMDSINV